MRVSIDLSPTMHYLLTADLQKLVVAYVRKFSAQGSLVEWIGPDISLLPRCLLP